MLQAYSGIKPQKLFQSIEEISKSLQGKFQAIKTELPEALSTKFEKAISENDFSFSKILSEHYNGLNECKTLADAKKMYPELNIPKTPKEMVKDEIKAFIPSQTYNKARGIANKTEQAKFLDSEFDKILAEPVKKAEYYPKIKEILNELKEEIATVGFERTPHTLSHTKYGQSGNESLARKLLNEDYDKFGLDVLRQSYIDLKNLNEISVKLSTDVKINCSNLKKTGFNFSTAGKDVKSFMQNAEKAASEIKDVKGLSKSAINSAVWTQTWKDSRLRVDLANADKQEWQSIRRVWQKTMFPETTYFPTDKLIDGYLLNLYKSGQREVEHINFNPFAKHLENPNMDKSKKLFINKLYKFSQEDGTNKQILNSSGFKDFKAQFDIEGMSEAIEKTEDHYKNSFFKTFWTDARRARFKEALNKNTEIIKEKIELTDQMLQEAMDAEMGQLVK